MNKLGHKYHRATKPDAQGFDEIRITTVPRYKTSGLSGNEWRISAKVELMRNGKVFHEQGFGNVESAAKFLPHVLATALDDAKGYFAGEEDFCDQEGCAEKATVTYKLKNEYCNRGEAHEIKFSEMIRMFCDRHSKRGDCGLDDSDANYEVIEGGVVEPRAEDESPSKFGGVISI